MEAGLSMIDRCARELKSASAWFDAVLGFVYPEICQLCGEESARRKEGYLGPRCAAAIDWVLPPFCRRCGLPFYGNISEEFTCGNCRDRHWFFVTAQAAVIARGVALDVIHRFKYQRALWFESVLADLLTQKIGPWLRENKCDLLVPVPLHPVKEREREFNQAERLTRRLSQTLRIPMNARLVQRVKYTGTQTLLTRRQRTENMHKAFAVKMSEPLTGRNIVLVDDVFTTGATVNDCSRALKAAGAANVHVWTLARALG